MKCVECIYYRSNFCDWHSKLVKPVDSSCDEFSDASEIWDAHQMRLAEEAHVAPMWTSKEEMTKC